MAFALGFAGGFADVPAEPGPEPTPIIVGRGTGALLYPARWVPRPRQPAPAPARITVTLPHANYRWSVAVTRLALKARFAQATPRLSFRVAAITMWLRARGATAKTTVKVVKVDVDQVALSRFAYETRELTEVAVALTAWQ
jgi:hypothetical protein